MQKILITGVAGFVGSNLLKKLLNSNYQVIGLDNLSQGDLRNLEPYKSNSSFEFIEGDIRNASLIDKLVQKVDAVVHLAAFKIPRYGNAMDTLKINTHGTKNIFESGSKFKKKVVFTSTSDVYGKNPNLPFSEESDLFIGQTSIKRWSYAVSKLYDEHLAYSFIEEFDAPIAIIRYFGGYGPNQNLTWWGGPQSVFIEKAINYNNQKSVVLLEYPRKGVWAVGFATKENEGLIKEKIKEDLINVFVPTTPNPTSGFLLLVPKKDLIFLDISFEQASKFIVSAGTTNIN